MFSEAQINRYARHILLDGIGGIGQQRLLKAHLVLVGRGAAWAAALIYLVAAGVGRITLVQALPQQPITPGEAVLGLPPGANVAQLGAQLACLNEDTVVEQGSLCAGDGMLCFSPLAVAPTHPHLPWQLTVLGCGEGGVLWGGQLPATVPVSVDAATPLAQLSLNRLGCVAATEALKALLGGQVAQGELFRL
ncbi:molybdopterin biosynthesis protein [Magnetococcus marinus MC-1]|uniref:Molybdopterin biosynthesis protein n=1 Tax=Magnetococcus marinus (strain ATCC BAA-1437 / JCM 17883 / MC-1) TaxID=156889 RepID=A0LD58_MAGMM|nr:molybdopterin biosynthesis protein [Magnetococcus marinus]ABK45901.1 molybdopterin biosynthesis protein [Magnetococcus marinus MC-1]